MAVKKNTVKSEQTQNTDWQLPAIAVQLHKINQGSHNRSADLVESQIIGIKNGSMHDLYKIDFVNNHRPEHDMHDCVDMLVLSNIATKEPRTLTYWTDFELEILIPRISASGRVFMEDLLRPKLVVFGGADMQSAFSAPPAQASYAGKHSWPAVLSTQENVVRMEATENGEWKFWSIWKEGTRVRYWHGRIGEPEGTEGTYISTAVRSAGGADAFMQRKIAEKLRKGYVKLG